MWSATLLASSSCRAWSRIAVFVAFLVLTWLALAVGPLARRFVRDRRPAPAVIAVAVVAVTNSSAGRLRDARPDPSAHRRRTPTAANFASDRS